MEQCHVAIAPIVAASQYKKEIIRACLYLHVQRQESSLYCSVKTLTLFNNVLIVKKVGHVRCHLRRVSTSKQQPTKKELGKS